MRRKSKKKCRWTRQQDLSSASGTGSKQLASSLQRKRKVEREKRARKSDDYFLPLFFRLNNSKFIS
jgi:hypothetical protein